MDRFQLSEIGRGNFDRIASHRQANNIFPGVQLVLVLDHLWSLPIVLDPGALQRKLLDFDGNWTTSLSFNDGNIVLRFATVHVNHPRLGDDSANDDILGFPVLR